MPLGTLDHSPPPIFKQGQSAFSRLLLFSALALFLMVADARFQLTHPLRVAIATVLHPLQWLIVQPKQLWQSSNGYLRGLHEARRDQRLAQERLIEQAQRSATVEQLELENKDLRKLLMLRQRVQVPAQAAEVIYDTADSFTRRVVVDKGSVQGVKPGSPVMDESGILGQVTRVYPLSSEVTLITDREHTIGVLNTRTGARSVVYGDPNSHGGTLELRFMAGNADVHSGDLLSTSGVDGVYPPGIPVARIDRVERRADSAFAKIFCRPLANILGARQVLVLDPISAQIPAHAGEPAALSSASKRGRRP